ncbi:MAG: hypothetical protein LBK63_11895 [Treponema sp.]|nr:hypothetical protein [Treponema sp.]
MSGRDATGDRPEDHATKEIVDTALRLVAEDFPVTTIIDSRGNNLYETDPAERLRSLR